MTDNYRNIIQDITFIGSGIATSYTLIPLLNQLMAKSPQNKVNITVIEKSEEHFTGLAYGNRSGATALLITSLADFLPEGKERENFISWLSKNKELLIENLLDKGGVLTKNWVNTHKDEIANNNWENIYIPRRFFGKYISQKLNNIINKTKAFETIHINFVNDEVFSVNREDSNVFSLQLKNNQTKLSSKKVVLSVGIPPIKQLWPKTFNQLYKDQCILIGDPYRTGFRKNLNTITEKARTSSEKLNFVIIGSNASAMEMIYKINDIQDIKDQINTITVISPQGELPNSAVNKNTKKIVFIPNHLLKLADKENVTAKEIYEAAQKDLDIAEHKSYSAAITEVPISNGFKALLPKLTNTELKAFACHYGNEIGKRQRRAGKHYTDVVDNLIKAQKLINLKGYFEAIIPDESDKLRFSYKIKRDSTPIISERTVDVVINCTGGKTLNSETVSPLLDQVISSNLCTPNASLRGFTVDENFQASSNLYIAGPLLAGNIINSQALWHIEHCGRIIYLGKELAKQLNSSY
ncbi:FAD/NAD(P)-binding protein [Ichthyenterobacterium sp. W332]|uniref:FAD/NAD(P)-binding protein n=1 Tax=Microcosmobacter mediterraneus TaxID=3075607 RepID=A0ABU2YKM0_9FLAO|nr:FAD/NAD(P)-binding protein [Ichthyenterobacterium sp. W332]MDT0558725.1 FAD/NAD(P)-binding protein [Ichthyenterobacterium sp. W332]